VVSTNPPLLRRERYLILGTLLVLAALAWGLLIWQAPIMNNQGMGPERCSVYRNLGSDDGRDDAASGSTDDSHV